VAGVERGGAHVRRRAGPYTHFALKRLRRNSMRATFFLVSRNLPLYGSLVAREEPFGEIADHTRTHPNLPSVSAAAQLDEIAGAQTAIAAVAHRPVRVFRPPYGSRNPAIDAIARQHGCSRCSGTSTARTRWAPTTRRSSRTSRPGCTPARSS